MNNFSSNNRIKLEKRNEYLLTKNSLVKVVHDMNVIKYQINKYEDIQWNNNNKKYLGKAGIVIDSNKTKNIVKVLFPNNEECNDIKWFPIDILLINDETIKNY